MAQLDTREIAERNGPSLRHEMEVRGKTALTILFCVAALAAILLAVF